MYTDINACNSHANKKVHFFVFVFSEYEEKSFLSEKKKKLIPSKL